MPTDPSGVTEDEARRLGRIADAIGGVWVYDRDHRDWQPVLVDGRLGEPESWNKVNGNYGPARPVVSQ